LRNYNPDKKLMTILANSGDDEHTPNEEEFTDQYTCRYCNGDRAKRIYGPHPGGHFAKIVCLDCDRFQKWEGKPESRTGKRRDQAKLLDRFSKGFCEICLRKTEHIPLPQTLEAHHIIPVEDGGSDTADNIQIVCTPCHKWIHHQRTYFGHYTNSVFPTPENGRDALNEEIMQVISDRLIPKRQAIAILQSSFEGKQVRNDLTVSELKQLLAKLKVCSIEGVCHG
jgi:hypothetical protein